MNRSKLKLFTENIIHDSVPVSFNEYLIEMHRVQFSWPISDFFFIINVSCQYRKKDLYNKNVLNITIPPIWTKLQIFSINAFTCIY